MKTSCIIVLYHTPKHEVNRLIKEINQLELKDKEIFLVDNTVTNRGYGAAANIGLKKGLWKGCDTFIIMNPDISLVQMKGKNLFDKENPFDVWGYAMNQNDKKYFGGEIDPWSMSGGLRAKMPSGRFVSSDFVSGSFFCIKKSVINKVGLFDEKYFMYYEDVDYCYRAGKADFKIGVDTGISYEHFERSGENPEKEQILSDARRKFLAKFGGLRQRVYGFVQRILRSPFLFNFLSLNVSSLIIKLTSFINFLFLVRFLTAPEYGIYTLVWAQVSVLSPLADFGTTSYGVVYLSTEKRKTYASLFNFRIFVSFLVFLGTLILSVFLFRGSTKLYAYILVTSTVIFTNMFSGSYFILNALTNRLYISSRNSIIFNVLLVFAIAVSLISTHRLLWVFIIIFVAYNIYSIANYYFLKREIPLFRFRFEFHEWLSIFKRLYVFVLITFFAGLYARLDVFLLKIMKGETEVGIYSAGSKFLDALLFIAASYNVTATPILARLVKYAGALQRKLFKDFLFLLVIGFSISTALFFLSPYLLTYLLKKSFLPSIPVVRIVIFTLPFTLFNSIWLNVLYILKRPYLAIFVFSFQAVLNVVLNILFIPRYSYIASSYITVLSEIINCIVLFILVRIVWKKHFKS